MNTFSAFHRLASLALVMAMGLAAYVPQSWAASRPGARDTSAKVIQFTGTPMVIMGSSTQPIKLGMELKAGAVIVTAKGSTVVLDLSGGESGRVEVKEDSTLSIEKLTLSKDPSGTVVETELEVRKGSILGNVKKLSAASKYEVKTARGVAGIRGTLYQIFAVGIFRCADGSINVVMVTPQGITTFTVGPVQQLDGTQTNPTIQEVAQQIIEQMQREGAALLFDVPLPDLPTGDGTGSTEPAGEILIFVSPTRSTRD